VHLSLREGSIIPVLWLHRVGSFLMIASDENVWRQEAR
jgi:hypothetical protein